MASSPNAATIVYSDDDRSKHLRRRGQRTTAWGIVEHMLVLLVAKPILYDTVQKAAQNHRQSTCVLLVRHAEASYS